MMVEMMVVQMAAAMVDSKAARRDLLRVCSKEQMKAA